MMRNLCVSLLLLSVIWTVPAGGDWPQWRGPERNGVSPESVKLADRWPKKGPPPVWTTEELPRGSGAGYSCLSVVGDRAYVFINRVFNVPFEHRTLTTDGLRRLGWFAEKPPADVVAKIEQARTSPERAKLPGKNRNEWIKAWVETNLNEEQRKKFRNFATDRLNRGDKALPLELLDTLATIKDKKFASQAALDEWCAANGVEGDPKKAMQGVIATYETKADDMVFCFSTADGKTLWKLQEPGKPHGHGISGTVCVSEGRCYVVGTKGDLYCVDAASGSQVWKVQACPSGVHSSTAVADGKVVVLAGKLSAFDTKDGKRLWQAEKVGGGDNSPAIWRKDGKAYVICNTGKDVACVDLADGTLRWTAPGGGRASPTIAGDHLALLTDKKELGLVVYRLSPEKAEKLWNHAELTDGSACPVIHDGHVYVVATGRAACVELAGGKIVWDQKIPTAGWSSPAIADGKIYGVGGDSVILMLRATPEAYTALSRARVGAMQYTSPAIAGGRLYLRLAKTVGCFDLTQAGEPPAEED